MNELLFTILVSFLTALLTATFTFIGYWRKAKAELQREYKSRFNEKKWEVYQDFALYLARVAQDNYVIDPDDLLKASNELILVGSDEVIDAFNNFVSNSRAEGQNEIISRKMTAVLNEMRKDLGYKSKSDLEHLTLFS